MENVMLELEVTGEQIRNRIYTIRGVQVMLDSDLAAIYGYETKNFNRQVRNNKERFPADLMFQLTKEETDSISRCRNFTSIMQTTGMKGGRVYLPHVFTEQGIYMLMTVLKGELAVRQSLALVRAFKAMREYLADNAMVFQRLDRLELKQFEADEKFKKIFSQLEQPRPDKAVIFFKGQMWDATSCIEEIISKGEKSIILIDNYVDRKTLDLLSRKKAGIPVEIHTSKNSQLTEKEMSDFRNQYGPLIIKPIDEFHDRFLILDNKELYHIGASIKDSGKKAFEISLNEDEGILKGILSRL